MRTSLGARRAEYLNIALEACADIVRADSLKTSITDFSTFDINHRASLKASSSHCSSPPVAHLRPTRVRPRKMNRKARVTMSEGRHVRMTIYPLMDPMIPEKIRMPRIASHGAWRRS
jgi:hypothetical protein